MPAVRLIGPGRAGLSLVGALATAGWRVEPPLGRHDAVAGAATGVDLLVIATPDHAVAAVAAAVDPVASTVVAHLAGALGLDVLAPHARRASIHPMVPLPDPGTGAGRLAAGTWFAVDGDPLAVDVVEALGARSVTVPDDRRAAHHAAAAIAANHLVALLGQVERVAATAGVPLEAYLGLSRAALADVAERGPAAALTGPVARGDTATVAGHVRALAPAERPAYLALAAAAARLAGGRAWAVPSPVVVDRVAALRAALDGARALGLTVGLVPTMGALHEGHTSLVRRAADECDLTVVTVFVNPLQFGPGEDLAAYPRNLDADVETAVAAGADLVFAPSVAEMYPATAFRPRRPAPVASLLAVAGLDDVFEGASRPGHFAGVATVVAKLFNAAGPCRAYFGEKDWQQLLVVRRLAADLSFPVDVVACPVVRDADGLACSSRNARLSTDDRRSALVLNRALTAAAALVEAGEHRPGTVRDRMADVLASEPAVDTDYADVVGADDLTALETVEGDVRLLVAVRVGGVRLIDTTGLTVPAPADTPETVGDRRT